MTAPNEHSARLFPASAGYSGDPLAPDTECVTPPEVVAELSPADRVRRVTALISLAHRILGEAESLREGSTCVAKCLLWSGGNDSNTLAHLMRNVATHVLMANTGIGIEATRRHVRESAAAWGLPLIEKTPPDSYRDLVLDQGFPGPGMHWKMYQRLKERCFDAARHDLGILNSRTKHALYIAGRRREESERRKDVPLYEVDGPVVWVSPIAMWTRLDLNTYRSMFADVPHNEVTDLIHMSGECLCGAFAHAGEREEVGFWFPEWLAEIEALEAEVEAAGHAEPLCKWGWGKDWDGPLPAAGRLCGGCATRMQGQIDMFEDEATA